MVEVVARTTPLTTTPLPVIPFRPVSFALAIVPPLPPFPLVMPLTSLALDTFPLLALKRLPVSFAVTLTSTVSFALALLVHTLPFPLRCVLVLTVPLQLFHAYPRLLLFPFHAFHLLEFAALGRFLGGFLDNESSLLL